MKAITHFTGQMGPGNLFDNLYEAGVVLKHQFGEPYLDLDLYCIKRKKSNGFYKKGLISDEDIMLKEISRNEIKQTIEQKFTIHEIMLISGIFQMHYFAQVEIYPVFFPIEHQSPFDDYWEELYEVFYFDELKLYNLDFDVVGVGEHK